MKLKNKKLLIFDLDGTLINSALDLALAINHMLRTLDKPEFDEKVIHQWVGNGALVLVSRALSGHSVIDDTLDKNEVQKALNIFLEYYAQNLCNATIPYPAVTSTLHTLQKKYTLAIVTNKPFDFVHPILKTLEMDTLFEYILGGDSLQKKKPDPLPLLHVTEALHVSIEASVMIGDSKNDIQAANACGMDSVGVTYGYNYGEDITLYKPTLVIDNFSELLKVL